MKKQTTLLTIIVIVGIFVITAVQNAVGSIGEAEKLYRAGIEYYKNGDLDSAISTLKNALLEDLDNKTILNKLTDIIIEKEISVKPTVPKKSEKTESPFTVPEELKEPGKANLSTSEKIKETPLPEDVREFKIPEKKESTDLEKKIKELRADLYKPTVESPEKKETTLKLTGQRLLKLSSPDKTFPDPGVTEIQVLRLGRVLKVLIKVTEESSYITEKLYSPPMFVIDIQNTIDYLPLSSRMAINKGGLISIRHSQYRILPIRTTRIVLDLDDLTEVKNISRNKNNIIVDLYAGEMKPEQYRLIQRTNIKNPSPIKQTSEEITKSKMVSRKNISQKNIPEEILNQISPELLPEFVKVPVYQTEYVLTKISGDEQKTVPGSPVLPFKVQVVNKYDELAANLKITARINRGSGYFYKKGLKLKEVSANTDTNGIAVFTDFIPIRSKELNEVTIYPEGSPEVSVVFTVKSSGGIPYKIIKISGDNQKIDLNSSTNNPFVVRVVDWFNDPVGEGHPVIFTISEGQGEIDVNKENDVDNELIAYTDKNGMAKCDIYSINFYKGIHVIKAGIIIDEQSRRSDNLLVTTSLNISDAIGEILTGIKRPSKDFDILIFDSPDTLDLNDIKSSLYEVMTEKGKIDAFPQYKSMFINDKHENLSTILKKLADISGPRLKMKTFRTVDFTVIAKPRLISVDFKSAALADVVRTITELGNWNVTMSNEIEAGEFTVNIHLVDVPALEALDTILDMNGFTRIQEGNIMKIVSKKDIAKRPLKTKIGTDYREIEYGENYITQVINLKYGNSKEIMEAIKELLSEEGKVKYIASSNSLVITETKSNIKRLLKIIRTIDIAPSGIRDNRIKIYATKYEKPSIIKRVIENIYREASKSKSVKAKKSAKRNKLNEVEVKIEEGVKISGEVKIIDYDPKSLLIVSASKQNHKVIQLLLQKLDSSKGIEKCKMIDLSRYENVDPTGLKSLITNMKSLAANQRNGEYITPGGYIKWVGNKRQTVTDPRKYSLHTVGNKFLIFGDPGTIKEIEFVVSDILKTGINLSDLLTPANETKRITLNNITEFRLREFLSKIPGYSPPFMTKVGEKNKKDVLILIGTFEQLNDLERRIKAIDIPEVANVDLDGIVSEEIFFKNISLSSTYFTDEIYEKLIKKTLTPAGICLLNYPNNSITVIDESYNISQLKERLKKVDTDRTVVTEIIPLSYLEVNSLKELLNSEEENPGPIGRYLTKKAGADENAKKMIVAKANSLIISDFPPVIKQIKAVIEKLEKHAAKRGDWLITKVFYLKNSSLTILGEGASSDIKTALNNMITNKVDELGVEPTGKIFANISYHTKSNAVIVTTFKSKMKIFADLIEELDRREPQILLEVLVVERKITKTESLGIDYSYASNAPNIDEILRFNWISWRSGVLNTTINREKFNLVLQAIESDINISVLSHPKVVTLNNKKANINLKDQIPYQEAHYDDNGDVNYTIWRYKEINLINMDLMPVINNIREVLLNINVSVEAISGSSNRGELPPTSSKKIDSTFFVADNQTLVLGGIIRENNAQLEARFPGLQSLSKIPVIGPLFKTNTATKENSELLIFITPHIIDSPIESEKVTEKIKKEYKEIIKRVLSLNTATRMELVKYYLNHIYDLTVEGVLSSLKLSGVKQYNLRKALPAWLTQKYSLNFAESLADAIIDYRNDFGPITAFEQLQFITVPFSNINVPIQDELYNAFVKTTTLDININLSNVDAFTQIKSFDFTTSKKIVQFRDRIGYFSNKNEFENLIIKLGVPKKYYEKFLKPVITLTQYSQYEGRKILTGNKVSSAISQESYTEPGENKREKLIDKTMIKKDFERKPDYKKGYLPEPPLPETEPPPVKKSEKTVKYIMKPAKDTDKKLNLNTVSVDELQTELGLNKLQALSIIKYRERYGIFNSIADLKNIPGITEILYLKLKSKTVVY